MAKKNNNKGEIVIYQSSKDNVSLDVKLKDETIWLNARQMAQLFDVKRPAIVKHVNNIFKTAELDKESTCSVLEQVAADGKLRKMNFYNLDIIISVGYRVNSKKATQFRQWATKVLRQHIVFGYTINKKMIGRNYAKFTRAIADVKALLPAGNKVKVEDILELINAFAGTWFSLESYDKDVFPKGGESKKKVKITADDLSVALYALKKELMAKKQATAIFGQERTKDVTAGIVGNIFQSAFGKDVYPSTEEKAANLLYFMVKNHPFTDGNKRSGAFAFVWFLRQAGLLRASLTSEALTALTLLIAESRPKDKEKMIGLVLLLLRKK